MIGRGVIFLGFIVHQRTESNKQIKYKVPKIECQEKKKQEYRKSHDRDCCTSWRKEYPIRILRNVLELELCRQWRKQSRQWKQSIQKTRGKEQV